MLQLHLPEVTLPDLIRSELLRLQYLPHLGTQQRSQQLCYLF